MSATRETLAAAIDGADYPSLVAAAPYAQALGMRIEEDDTGLLFRLPFRDNLVGNVRLPALHGGVVAGFMENAATFQVLIEQTQRRIPLAIDFAIDYLRSAGPRETYARCRLARLGRRVAQVQIDCWQEDADRLVAFARSHFQLEANDE